MVAGRTHRGEITRGEGDIGTQAWIWHAPRRPADHAIFGDHAILATDAMVATTVKIA
jgi:hypothetical protein